MPFALIMTIAVVTVVLTLAQVVALGTLPALADVEDAARRRRRAVHGRDRRGRHHARRGALDAGQQHGAGALRLAQPVRARGERRRAARVRARSARGSARRSSRSSSPPRCRWCWPRPGRSRAWRQASAVSRLVVYVATCAAALRLRSPRFAGAGRRPATMTRAVRAGDSGRGDPDRARDPVRRHAGAVARRRLRARGGRRPLRHRRSLPWRKP